MTLPDREQHPGADDAANRPAVEPALRPAEKPVDVTVKETIESLVVALILAFVFRSFVVEAFVIPTGSMAPTLLGRHVPVTDPWTGYRFDVGFNRDDLDGLAMSIAVRSPMTGKSFVLNPGTRARAGDRILVLKYIYAFSEPRRWDVIVFKAPHNPSENYIKRLIGLPGESVALLDGDVYVRPRGADDFHIARKIDRPDVQRAVFQPIYHSRFVPLETVSIPSAMDESDRGPWDSPWQTDDPGWDLNGRTYTYAPTPNGPGRITFDFSDHGYAVAAMTHPYNQLPGSGMMLPQPIRDIRLAATVRATSPGVGVVLSTNAQLDRPDGVIERIEARIDASGIATLTAHDPGTGAVRPLADPVEVSPLERDQPRRVELWYVDQAALLWVDGEEVLRYTYDLPLETLEQRTTEVWTPDVAITVTGGGAALDDVNLDRDLYYGVEQDGRVARGGIVRRHPSQPAEGEPLVIPPDAFWPLGDNSPLSEDGRFWATTNPWVQQRMFDPRVADPDGLVPRKLMIGRAFFVYLPAPLPLRKGGPSVLPNFGDMRLIR